MADPVAIHSKDLNSWNTRVLKPVVKAEVRAE